MNAPTKDDQTLKSKDATRRLREESFTSVSTIYGSSYDFNHQDTGVNLSSQSPSPSLVGTANTNRRRPLVGSRSLSTTPYPDDKRGFLINPSKRDVTARKLQTLLSSTNSVQEMGKYRVEDLQEVSAGAGRCFLHANLSKASSLTEVMDGVDAGLRFYNGRNLDTFLVHLRDADCLLPGGLSGPQGVVIVMEHLPAHVDCKALLNVFREAADWWKARQVPFHCFYSYRSSDPFCDFVFRETLKKARRDARKPRKPKTQKPLGATPRNAPWFVQRVVGVTQH
jgi:hypothetical protein